MTEYTTRVTGVTVLPVGQPIFSEMSTEVQIVDEAGGEFVVVSQSGREDLGKIAINPEEWLTLRDAIDRMVDECVKDGQAARP